MFLTFMFIINKKACTRFFVRIKDAKKEKGHNSFFVTIGSFKGDCKKIVTA